jgi:hypothetical protein
MQRIVKAYTRTADTATAFKANLYYRDRGVVSQADTGVTRVHRRLAARESITT